MTSFAQAKVTWAGETIQGKVNRVKKQDGFIWWKQLRRKNPATVTLKRLCHELLHLLFFISRKLHFRLPINALKLVRRWHRIHKYIRATQCAQPTFRESHSKGSQLSNTMNKLNNWFVCCIVQMYTIKEHTVKNIYCIYITIYSINYNSPFA